MSNTTLPPSRRAITLGMLAAAAPACARAPAAAEEGAPRASPAVMFHRGIGVHHMMNWPRTLAGSESQFEWPPFQPADYLSTDAEFANIKNLGFDFVRFTINPGIFIASRDQRFEELLGILRTNIERLYAAGLNVIVDLHPSSNADDYSPERIVDPSPSNRLFPRYVEMVAGIARFLSTMGDRVWFELMNEPEIYGPQGPARWRVLALQLAQAARAEAPNLTLVVDSSEMASWRALAQFEPLPASLGPIVYTFHYYSPAMFTMQTEIDSSKYITGMDWPPDPSRMQATIARARARIMADTELAPSQRERVAREQQRNIEEYYNDPHTLADVRSDFDAVAAWADRHQIARSSVLLGEFGCIRTHWRYTGADEPSRERWLETVRREAEARGFPWSVWVYSGWGGMAITDRDDPMAFDPLALRALGLTAP